MKMKKSSLIAAIMMVSAIGVAYVAYDAFVFWQDGRQAKRAMRIQQGMNTDDVVQIMGKPKYTGYADSDKIPAGLGQDWIAHYEEVSKKKERLLFYNYHLKKYLMPAFRETSSGLQINVYFGTEEQKVVYVSRYVVMERGRVN